MYSGLTVASLLLAATGALAVPQQTTSSYGDFSVDVLLQNSNEGATTSFKNVNRRRSKPARGTGPFDQITINLADEPANPALRCAALDASGNFLVAARGGNLDTTFSDQDKGEWLFQDGPVDVARIVCDPAFVADPTPIEGGDGDDTSITVQLSDGNLATQTVFEDFDGRDASAPTGSSGPYDEVTILVGDGVDPETRCKLLNRRGRAIVAQRGENIDTTFSDADKGKWDFLKKQRVGRVICDQSFVANPQ